MADIPTRKCAECGKDVEPQKRGPAQQLCCACRLAKRKAKQAECQKKKRQSRFQAGTCVECGKKPAAPNIKRCQDCESRAVALKTEAQEKRQALIDGCICLECGKKPWLNASLKLCRGCDLRREPEREFRRLLRQERIQKNLCVDCGEKPSVTKKHRCQECDEIHQQIKAKRSAKPPDDPDAYRQHRRLLNKERRAKIIADNPGLCHHCLKVPAVEGKKHCLVCADRSSRLNKARYNRRKQAGLCIRCGQASDSKQYCATCRDLQKAHSQKHRHKIVTGDKCHKCGVNDPEPGLKCCSQCNAMFRAQYHLNKLQKPPAEAEGEN